MTDFEYIQLARRDTTWQDIVASFAIGGMTITIDNEIIEGKLISGEVLLAEAIRLILQKACVTQNEANK
jgi:hypothetical protein